MYIIAEIGSNIFKFPDNPKANLNVAYEQIEKAKECQADAVKFQLYTSKELYGETVEEVDKFAMPPNWIPKLSRVCDMQNIDFLCTAFSPEGYRLVDPYVLKHKVASPEACDPNLRAWLMLNTLKPIIWSNGCKDISWAAEKDIVLNCASAYPATIDMYSVQAPHKTWGISDHTFSSDVAYLAAMQGGTYFEKHVDLCPGGSPTPDTEVSIGRADFSKYIARLHNTEMNTAETQRSLSAKLYGRKIGSGMEYYRPIN